ncbi:NTPase [Burkholderiaceae bacterium 26]|nr:NTPase [Burkholderiaceae bacterium 26]
MMKLRTPLPKWWARLWATPNSKSASAQLTDSGIGAEAPIRTASEDRLRRLDFAGHIASLLSELSVREGRVFAIRGGWGFGKSSLKNLITERLDEQKDRAVWLDFNPWQWGDGDAIARALFGQMADRLGGEHSTAARARAEALRRYGEILTGASAPLKKAADSSPLIATILTNASIVAIASAIGFDLPTAAKVAAVFACISAAASTFGRLLSHLGRDRSDQPLDKVRKGLEDQLRKLERPLIVFVDDIDRLEPEQIRMLLRQVKANANLPNIVFVLLFQPSIVEAALDPVADGDGRAFLEKVVQVSFDLPSVPTSVVHRIFAEELGAMVDAYATEANGFSQTRWGNAFVGCIQPFLRSMRHARRLISSIAIHVPLHVDEDVFEVNLIDFLILETLRVFEPDLHAALFRERELVLQEHRYMRDGRRDADKNEAARLLEIVSEERRAAAQAAIKELFPPFEWAFGGSNYVDSFQTRWLAAKRVCSPRYFPRYFELQTAAGEISERRFVAFLDATATEDGISAAIASLETEGLLPSLIARLDESVDRLPVENSAVILPAMFSIAQKFSGGVADPFSSPWLSAWRATSWFLKRIPAEDRKSLALAALHRTEALSLAAILIHLSDPADRSESSNDSFDPDLDAETVEAMKGEWLRIVRSRAASNSLAFEPDLVPLLYRWRDYSHSMEEPRAWLTQSIRTDAGFASMVSRMMTRGSRYSAGDRVSTPHYTFNKGTVDDFIGIDAAKQRCDAIDPSNFPEHEIALRALNSCLELWLGLRKPGPEDF